MNEKLADTVDALIFDMDGTLWDGVDCYAGGFNDYFKANKIERFFTREDIKGYMGWEEDVYLETTLPEYSYDDRKKFYKQVVDFQYKRIESGGGFLYDHVKQGLQKLSEKYKLFIVSNCSEYTIDYFVKRADIEELIVDSMAHGQNYKAKHENIQLLIDRHGLKNPYYVGDTDSDGKQSRLVPLPYVFVDYGFGTTEDYDLKFSEFSQLTDYFMGEM